MARKPQPGGDRNAWGTILNEFFDVSHNTDGTIKPAGVQEAVATEVETALAIQVPPAVVDAVAADSTVTAAAAAAVDAEPRVSSLINDVADAQATADLTASRSVDIRSHGAVGDGLTDYTIETAAIQSAIDSAGDKWVIVPPGVYDVGIINVTSTARIKLEEGATLRKRGGGHSENLFNFTGTELVIRGPGVIDGNRHNNRNATTGVYGRPNMVYGECQEGKTIDIEDVHFKSVMNGVRINQLGGYFNFSRNRITDQGQHQQASGAHTTIAYINSGQIGAQSPLIRFNHNYAYFDDALEGVGTAPGGLFVCDSNQPTTTLGDGNQSSVEAIGNYFYGYGQNNSTNEINPMHFYPAPANLRIIGNFFDRSYTPSISAKSVTNFVCIGNVHRRGVYHAGGVPTSAAILYAPGYHADLIQRHRAVIANNIIDDPGGSVDQAMSGISVNSTADSNARDIVVTGNVVNAPGNGILISYARHAVVSDNVIRTATGPSLQARRGITVQNMVGDVLLSDNMIYATDEAIYAGSTTNAGGRLFIDGGVLRSERNEAIEARGMLLLSIKNTTTERTNPGVVIYVTQDGSSNKVGKLIYDRSNTALSGIVNLDHTNIIAFEGQEPLRGTPSVSVGSAAGTGATASITGDGDKGTITITMGTSPTSGAIASVSLASAMRSAPIVSLHPANDAAAARNGYVSASTTNSFTMAIAGAAPAASAEYRWHYRIT